MLRDVNQPANIDKEKESSFANARLLLGLVAYKTMFAIGCR